MQKSKKELYNERIRHWKLAHPEKIEVYRKLFYSKNKEFYKKYNKTYQLRKRIISLIDKLDELEVI